MANPTTEELIRLANTIGVTTASFNELLQGLVQVNNANQAAANSTLKNVNARTVEEELMQKRNEREQAMITLFQSLGSGITKTINGLGNFTTQLYTSSDAFAAAKISFEAFSEVFKAVTKIIKETASVFSFLSGAGRVFETLANAGLDVAMNAFKNRLEQAQILTNTFESVGRAGATFGGSLNILFESAKQSGINLQEFGKFVVANVTNLSGYGQSLAKSASSIGRLTTEVGNLAPELLALKGGYKELGEATAEYMALQKQIGIVESTTANATREAVRDYIRQQNILTEITGKSAADQRRQAEERRNVAAFNVEAAKLDQTARNNLDMVMNLGGSIAPELHKYLLEFFSSQGNVIDQMNVKFANQFPELVQMFTGILGNLNQPAEQFARNMGTTVQAGMPAIRAQMEQYSQMGFLQLAASGVNNEFIQTIARVIAGLQRTSPALERLGTTIPEITAQIAASMAPGSATQTAADLIRQQNARLVQIDGIAQRNFETISNIVAASNKIADAIIKAEEGLGNLTNKIISGNGVVPALDKFKDDLQSALEGALGLTRGPPPDRPYGAGGVMPTDLPALAPGGTSSNEERRLIQELIRYQLSSTRLQGAMGGLGEQDPARAILEEEKRKLQQEVDGLRRRINELRNPNPRGQQEGGIAAEPTIVGENNQPEAVIPLARGNIPLNINFEPMLRIMEQQREYLEEILAATNGNSDYLERIYHASS